MYPFGVLLFESAVSQQTNVSNTNWLVRTLQNQLPNMLARSKTSLSSRHLHTFLIGGGGVGNLHFTCKSLTTRVLYF